jgi:glycerol kinase
MATYLSALDQGTTSTRFIVFDLSGRIVAQAQREHEQIYPAPGWVEHDPLEIWRRTLEVIEEVCASGRIDVSVVAAMGITNQRETTVLWDRRTGRPVSNAIVWQDTRVRSEIAALDASGMRDEIVRRTGLPLATYFSGLKIGWILDHVPEARKRAEVGELLFGHNRQFSPLEFDGWCRRGAARHRRHQCEPHATNGSRHVAVGVPSGNG